MSAVDSISSDLPSEVRESVAHMEASVSALESTLRPLLAMPPSELAARLSEADLAKLRLFLAYGVNSLYFSTACVTVPCAALALTDRSSSVPQHARRADARPPRDERARAPSRLILHAIAIAIDIDIDIAIDIDIYMIIRIHLVASLQVERLPRRAWSVFSAVLIMAL